MSFHRIKPILFNTEMVRAILDGRKTVTRRVIKPHFKDGDAGFRINRRTVDGVITGVEYYDEEECGTDRYVNPPYQIGDILCVMSELKGYDCKYACDLIGNIFSKASGNWKQLKPHDQGNYKRLMLRKNGKDVNKCVHNLVCEAWYGNKLFEKAIVRHLDGNSHNNRANNLDWGTYKQNWDDRKYDNRGIHEEHHNAKITMDDAKAMRASGKTYQELCKEYGLTSKTVQRILNNETWIEHYDKTPPNYERWLPDENIWLKVTDVRVERLQDITEDDVCKEGAEPLIQCDREHATYNADGTLGDMCWNTDECSYCPFIEKSYSELFGKMVWNSTIKKQDLDSYGWDANPWVFVVSFERIERIKL